MESNWGTGNDYSMLLHAVENNIGDVIDVSASEEENENSNEMNSDFISNDEESDNDDRKGNEATLSTSDRIKLRLELDDAKLRIEELLDKLRSSSDDFKRERDKLLRQVDFLENENSTLKKDLSVRTEKYYETKKKLQVSVRTAASEKSKLLSQLSEQTKAPSQVEPSSRKAGDLFQSQDNHSLVDEKFLKLESQITEKCSEVKKLSVQNSKLEEQCTQLQQQVLLLRSDDGKKDELAHLKELQSRVRELEFSLRQRNRDYEKLEKSSKNAHVLEQNLSTCNSKVEGLQESLKSYRSMEVDYNSLLQEKKDWSLHFKDIMKQNGVSDVKDERNITPISVLRLLSNFQSKCASLLHENGDLQNKNSELVSASKQAVNRVQQIEIEIEKSEQKISQLERKNSLLSQQVSLFEGEVFSLRSLLKTFDSEMSMIGNKKKRSRVDISSPSTQCKDDETSSEFDALLDLKNKEIAQLRDEMDKQRLKYSAILKDKMDSEDPLARNNSIKVSDDEHSIELDGLKAQVKYFKNKCNTLAEDLYMLERATALDFIPSKTKVLHMKGNPSLLRYNATEQGDKLVGAGSDDKSEKIHHITPLDELIHLKKQIRAGKLVSSENEQRPRSDSSSLSGGVLDVSTSVNNSRGNANASMTAAGGIDSQKMNQRLKEAFREKIAEYREAVYLLFGYKVDLMPANTITGDSNSSLLKLRSMYAESPDDCLKFVQRKDRDGLEMIETPFATTLDDSIMLSLTSSNSIPFFLAEVTQDLFGKQTFMG